MRARRTVKDSLRPWLVILAAAAVMLGGAVVGGSETANERRLREWTERHGADEMPRPCDPPGPPCAVGD